MHPRGFTLIEWLVTLSITATLLHLALPAFDDFIARQRATAALNAILGGVQFARAAAATHRQTVTFCPSQGAEPEIEQAAHCGARGNWHLGGWIFADLNRNAEIDAGERVYGALPALPRGSRLIWRSFRNRGYLRFRANGLTDWQNGHFQYCPPDGDPRYARQVILNAQGRARIARDGDGDGIVEDARGRPLQC